MAIGGSLKISSPGTKELNLKVSNNVRISIKSGKNELTNFGDVVTNVQGGKTSNTTRIAKDSDGNIFKKANQSNMQLSEQQRFDIFSALVALDGDSSTLSIEDAKRADVLKGKNGVKNVAYNSASGVLTIIRTDGVEITLDFETDRERAKTRPTENEKKKTQHYKYELGTKYYTDPDYKGYCSVDAYSEKDDTLYICLTRDVKGEEIIKDFGYPKNTDPTKETFKKGTILIISNISNKQIRDRRSGFDKFMEGVLDVVNELTTTQQKF